MDYKNYKLEDPITKVLSACDKLVNDIIKDPHHTTHQNSN
jgi:hypothetical protein